MKVNFILASLLLSGVCSAQEALWSGAGPVISPQVNPDNSVTFRYTGPGHTVSVTGDFLPRVKVETPHGTFDAPGSAPMAKDSLGVWSITTVPLDAELYLYTFIVDSIPTLDPLNINVTRDITSFTNVLLVPGENSLPYDFNENIPHGTVRKMWYKSDSLNIDRRLSVYTPAGYEENPDRKYPVLYLLHGMGGDENAWLENGRLAQIMDKMIADGLTRSMIVVMPNGNPKMRISPAERSLLTGAPQMAEYQVVDGSFEASFPEIVEFIDANFRTLPQKENRALAGLSMGGFHSLTISKEFPELFDYVGLFSAATHRTLNKEGFIKCDKPEINRDYEGKISRQFADGLKLYWIGIGKDDFLYESNVDYRKMLDNASLPYEYYESEGGHTWRNWRDYIKIFSQKLFKQD